MIFVRWQKDQARRQRVFAPLQPDHPAVDVPCPACGFHVGTDLPVQLIAVGPVDEEDTASHNAGYWYSAGAVLLHQHCADGLNDADLDELVSELDIVPMGGAS